MEKLRVEWLFLWQILMDLKGYSAELTTSTCIFNLSDAPPLQALPFMVTDRSYLPSIWHYLDSVCGHRPTKVSSVSVQRTISLSLRASRSCHFGKLAAKASCMILYLLPSLNPWGQHILKVWCAITYYTSRFPIFFDKHHKYDAMY